MKQEMGHAPKSHSLESSDTGLQACSQSQAATVLARHGHLQFTKREQYGEAWVWLKKENLAPLITISFLLKNVFPFVCIRACQHVCIQKSEDIFWSSLLLPCELWHQCHVMRLDGKLLYSLSYLADPQHPLKKKSLS